MYLNRSYYLLSQVSDNLNSRTFKAREKGNRRMNKILRNMFIVSAVTTLPAQLMFFMRSLNLFDLPDHCINLWFIFKSSRSTNMSYRCSICKSLLCLLYCFIRVWTTAAGIVLIYYLFSNSGKSINWDFKMSVTLCRNNHT